MANTPLTKVWVAGEPVVYSDLNSNFGNLSADYNGNITDFNIATNAAIQAAKGESGGFAVLAGANPQTIAGITKHQMPWTSALSGNSETITAAASIAVNGTTLYKIITGTTGINTITGGVEGQRIVLICVGPVITHTATDTANKIHLKGRANKTVGATAPDYDTVTLVCSKLAGLTTNLQWWEVEA